MATTHQVCSAPHRRRAAGPVRGSNALLLGLAALVVATGFVGGRALHVAAGMALTAGVAAHVWKRRGAL